MKSIFRTIRLSHKWLHAYFLNHQDFSLNKICKVQYQLYNCKVTMAEENIGLPIKTIVEKLSNIAPLSLAESWDNVGLLVEPSTPKLVKKLFLTNDLTEIVLEEAVNLKTDFIISYHPPIFVPLKSLTTRTWKERVIVKCIENRIAVFSPHTSYDSVHGGVNDWMASAFGSDCVVEPLKEACCPGTPSHSVEVTFQETHSPAMGDFGEKLQQGGYLFEITGTADQVNKKNKISIPCTKKTLPRIVNIFNEINGTSSEGELSITKYDEVPIPQCGTGRMCTLKQPLSVKDIVQCVKLLIKRPSLRLALVPGCDMNASVSTIAICVGSGTSVLRGVQADLYLTGEMLHHDVLDAVHNGSHVILCNHSDSERGFLDSLASKLSNEFKGFVEIVISKEDHDPLNTV